MSLPVEVYATGRKLEVALGDLSRTGMFLGVATPIAVGSIVHIAMEAATGHGARVVTAGTVVHTLDEATARALGRPPGIGVELRDPIRPGDQQFAETIDALIARHARPRPPRPARRILIADAHTGLLERMSIAFGEAGFVVATATTGLEALGACLQARPDVILLERGLPVVDGFEVLAQLAARPALAGIPVIISSYDPADGVAAFELGALDFVTRPFGVRELIHRADRLARGAAPERAVLLRGSLAAVALPSLLTMFEHDRRTGRLELTSGARTGSIELVNGRIVDARSSDLAATPHAALMALLDWRAGEFELAPGTAAPRVRDELAIPLTHLLLEHARRSDETARVRLAM